MDKSSELKPTREEIREALLSTLRHSCQVEYYLEHLGLGERDPQRPHDITGKGSKYSWSVLRGLAVQHRDPTPEFFALHVLPSIEIHRRFQYHHQMWNQPNPHATSEDMKVGAVDALSSLLDDRPYQGGAHSFEQMIDVIKRNEPHKVKWFWMVYSEMKRLPKPDTSAIVDLADFPNIGLSDLMYDKIVAATRSAIEEYLE